MVLIKPYLPPYTGAQKIKKPKPKINLPKFGFPDHMIKRYTDYLTAFCTAMFSASENILVRDLPHLVLQSDAANPTQAPVITDTWVTDLEGNIQQMYNAVPIDEWTDPSKLEPFVYGIDEANKQSFSQLTKAFYGVDIFVAEPWLATTTQSFALQNTTLIKNLQDTFLTDLSVITNNSIQSGARAEDIANLIRERYSVTQSRADLIARDQMSKLNGQVNQKRQQSAGFTEYVWQTSEDERVRPTHEDNAGKTFSWDDPPSDTGHPGEDIQCRCVAIPVFYEE